MIIAIKKFVKENKFITVQQLHNKLGIDPHHLFDILEMMVAKNQIRKISLDCMSSCHSGCVNRNSCSTKSKDMNIINTFNSVFYTIS